MPAVHVHVHEHVHVRRAMSFFGELYLRSTLPFLSGEVTAREVDCLRRAFSTLAVPGPIADLGCGHGRHCAPLSTILGRPLVGLDADPLSLAERVGPFDAVQADFFHLPFRDRALAGAYAWYSTLFVFPDEQIPRLFREIARALKPGALLVFHTVPYQRVSAAPTAQYDGTLPSGAHLIERCTFDPQTGRDEGFRQLTQPDGRVLSGHYFIRYYPLPQMTRLIGEAGFKVRFVHGDLDGRPLSDESADLIVGATRA